MERRHLEVVDTDTGELVDCPGCAERELEIEGLQESLRSQGAKIRQLRRDRESEARSSRWWPEAIEAFKYWQVCCDHGRSEFNAERFLLVEPFLKRDGLDLVRLAIDGAAYQPYQADKPNRNGVVEVYDSWETIFKNRASFERHCNRAPRERMKHKPPLDPLQLRLKAETILTLMPQDGRTVAERAYDAVSQARAELGSKADRSA